LLLNGSSRLTQIEVNRMGVVGENGDFSPATSDSGQNGSDCTIRAAYFGWVALRTAQRKTAIRRTACDHLVRWRRSPHRSARGSTMTVLTHLACSRSRFF